MLPYITEEGKEELDLERFVAQIGGEEIDHEEYLRCFLQEQEGSDRDPDGWCKLERDDRIAFLTAANDFADGMEKSREWITFNNGKSYYWVCDVKETIEHFYPESYDYSDELRKLLEFWL